MEENLATNQTPTPTSPQAQAPSVAQVQPVVQTPPVQQEAQSLSKANAGNNNKRLVIEVIVFVALLGLLAYLLFTKNQSIQNKTTILVPSPTSGVSQTQEEQDLEKIDVGSLDADLQDIEADLQKL